MFPPARTTDYTIHEDVAWDHLFLSEQQRNVILQTDWDVVGIGVLGQRTPHNQAFYQDILGNIQAKDIFLDINLRKKLF